jgi:ribosomal 50S subunit-recycling heat shock protein
VQHQGNGVVRAAAEVSPGEELTIRFAADQLAVRACAGTDDG